MQIIPLRSVPSQVITVVLNNQQCLVRVYQQWSGLYLDLYVNGVLIVGGVLCQALNRIVRDMYLGFVGDLVFIDNFDSLGDVDPDYTKLDGRFDLAYLAPADIKTGILP